MKRIFLLLVVLIQSLVAFGQKYSVRALDMDLSNYTYPFDVHYVQLPVQQQTLRMAYMDVAPGATATGQTVLLLHGKNFNGAYWEATARALAAKGFRVIIPDQVGFGKSVKPACLQYNFQQLALNTKMLLDSLGITSVYVVGHSMGGMIATRFALLYPAITAKLVLENPIGLEDWKTVVPYASVDQQYRKELQQNYDSLKKYEMANYYHGTWKPEYDRWLNLLAGWTLHSDYPKVAWNAALTSDMIFTQPVCYEFKNIKSPTLLIIGQADRTAIGRESASPEVKSSLGNYPLLGKRTQFEIPGAQLVEIDGVGHIPHIESFDQFIGPLLGFLLR